MRARRWVGLVVAAGLLVAGVDVPRLAAAPVPTGETDEVVVEPPAMDPGVSPFVTPETPAYKEHEVVAPPVVTVDVTAPADAAAKVGALPVTVQALPEVGVGLASVLVADPKVVADPSVVTDSSSVTDAPVPV